MKKIVNYKVSGEEWTKAKDEAFAKIVKKAKVDGFRQGKVPRSVFEKKYGTGDIISEAMEKIVDAKYGETIVKEKLIPVVEPKLEIEKANEKLKLQEKRLVDLYLSSNLDVDILSVTKMKNNKYSNEFLGDFISKSKEYLYIDGIISCPYVKDNKLKDILILVPKTKRKQRKS